MSYISQCLEKFRSLPEETKNTLGGVDALLVIKELEAEYLVNLSFAVILVAIGELTLESLPDYLSNKYGFSDEDADDIVDELVEKIFSKLKEQEELLLNKEKIEEILIGDFLQLFRDHKKIELINKSIFDLLSRDGSLLLSLGKGLMENKTILTSGTIISDQKKLDPTVENWLKDFLKIYGSDLFDDLVLAEYLSKAPNVKMLNDNDKKSLSSLLKTYRNIYFFLEITENKPVKSWEIFPVSDNIFHRDETSKNSFRENISSPESFLEKHKEDQRRELEESLRTFQSGSLEHRAASEELARLDKNIN